MARRFRKGFYSNPACRPKSGVRKETFTSTKPTYTVLDFQSGFYYEERASKKGGIHEVKNPIFRKRPFYSSASLGQSARRKTLGRVRKRLAFIEKGLHAVAGFSMKRFSPECLAAFLAPPFFTSQRLGGTRVAFLHARTPTHSPPDVKTGRGAPRSLYTLLNLCMSLFCLLRVSLFALGRVSN